MSWSSTYFLEFTSKDDLRQWVHVLKAPQVLVLPTYSYSALHSSSFIFDRYHSWIYLIYNLSYSLWSPQRLAAERAGVELPQSPPTNMMSTPTRPHSSSVPSSPSSPSITPKRSQVRPNASYSISSTPRPRVESVASRNILFGQQHLRESSSHLPFKMFI